MFEEIPNLNSKVQPYINQPHLFANGFGNLLINHIFVVAMYSVY